MRVSNRRRSPIWMRAMQLFLGAAVIGIMVVIFLGLSPVVPANEDASNSGSQSLRVLLYAIGVFFFLAAVGAYSLIIATNCFTSRFERPYFKAFKSRIYGAMLVVTSGLMVSAICVLHASLIPYFERANIPDRNGFAAIAIAVGIVEFLSLGMFDIFAPIGGALPFKRQQARGLPDSFIKTGIAMGISDPDQSSVRKTMVEDDEGLLWITPGTISYRGDAEDFDVGVGQFVEIERRVDPWSMAALGGVVHTILHIRRGDGSTRRIRFHPSGLWTMRSRAMAADSLAEQLTAWYNEAAAAMKKETSVRTDLG